MEGYKKRFIAEYLELQDKFNKLDNMLEKFLNDELDFKFKCPVKFLVAQKEVMSAYLGLLETRAKYEDIDLEEFK